MFTYIQSHCAYDIVYSHCAYNIVYTCRYSWLLYITLFIQPKFIIYTRISKL